MGVEFASCSLNDWAAKASLIKTSNALYPIRLYQNTFFAVQFIDDEKELLRPKAYCLKVNDQAIAWCMVYYVNHEVIRIRGLYTDPSFRSQGYMATLISNVISNYQYQAKKCLMFSLSGTVAYLEKQGFQKVTGFTPRPIEIYNSDTETYTCDPEDKITLLEKRF